MDHELSDVLCILEGNEKFKALREMVLTCPIFSELGQSREEFLSSVIARERLESTYVGHGVALSHGKVPHLKKTRVALGISEGGIAFKNGGENVHLLFVIASPAENNLDYLREISALLTWVHDKEIRRELRTMKKTDSVNRFLSMLTSQHFNSLLKERALDLA